MAAQTHKAMAGRIAGYLPPCALMSSAREQPFVSKSSVYLGLSACAFAIAAANSAYAADTATATTSASTATTAAAATTTAAADGTAEGPDSGLQQIVVTATKRETDLQKTPIAIDVIDPQMIKDRHIQSLMDLADGSRPGAARRDVRGAPVGADRRYSRHRPVRPEPDRARHRRGRLYRRRLSGPLAGPERGAVRRRADRSA